MWWQCDMWPGRPYPTSPMGGNCEGAVAFGHAHRWGFALHGGGGWMEWRASGARQVGQCLMILIISYFLYIFLYSRHCYVEAVLVILLIKSCSSDAI
jgi:hypothetical protein